LIQDKEKKQNFQGKESSLGRRKTACRCAEEGEERSASAEKKGKASVSRGVTAFREKGNHARHP